MAYDTVIDKTQLETAMRATATAIREKTGEDEELEWHQTKGFADFISAIATGGGVMMVTHDITIETDLGQPSGNNSTVNILTDNEFVKENYDNDFFAALLLPYPAIEGGANYVMHGVYHGNLNIGSVGAPRYGMAYASTAASSVSTIGMDQKISGNGYNISLRANSDGNLMLYVANNRTAKAGSYKLILMCANNV